MWREENGVIKTGQMQGSTAHLTAPDINTLPFVNWAFLADDPFRASDGRIEANMVGARGCPYLAMAEALIERIDPTDLASGICSARTFARMAGSCFLQLGQIPLALRFLDEARGTQTKSGAIVLANLATAHLHGNDLDAAAAHLHLAIDELERTRSGGGCKSPPKPPDCSGAVATGAQETSVTA